MRERFLLLLLLLGLGGLLVAMPSAAWAQGEDDEGDEDEDDGELEEDTGGTELDEERSPARRTTARARTGRERPSREVVKGAYLRFTTVPFLIWVMPGLAPPLVSRTASQLHFAFGYDIVDRLAFTLTVEGQFYSLVTNGTGASEGGLPFLSPIQGDFRLFGGMANLRLGPNFGGKRIKRHHIGIRAGGGVGYSPPLVELNDPDVIARSGGSLMQGKPLGIISLGVGWEYYTKLSHFSINIIEVGYDLIVGGPVVAGGVTLHFLGLKYTF